MEEEEKKIRRRRRRRKRKRGEEENKKVQIIKSIERDETKNITLIALLVDRLGQCPCVWQKKTLSFHHYKLQPITREINPHTLVAIHICCHFTTGPISHMVVILSPPGAYVGRAGAFHVQGSSLHLQEHRRSRCCCRGRSTIASTVLGWARLSSPPPPLFALFDSSCRCH